MWTDREACSTGTEQTQLGAGHSHRCAVGPELCPTRGSQLTVACGPRMVCSSLGNDSASVSLRQVQAQEPAGLAGLLL
jgi:hypothetical protein